MKKLIIIGLIACSFAAKAQIKPDTTVSIQITHKDAVAILEGLKAAKTSVPVSDVITAKQADNAYQVIAYLGQIIWAKFPDLKK